MNKVIEDNMIISDLYKSKTNVIVIRLLEWEREPWPQCLPQRYSEYFNYPSSNSTYLHLDFYLYLSTYQYNAYPNVTVSISIFHPNIS